MSDVTLGNRLDRPVDDKSDHVLGAAGRRHHAGRIRQLRVSLLPCGERADRGSARSVRRPHALRLPPSASRRRRACPPRRRTGGAGRRPEGFLGRAYQADDALRDPDRGRREGRRARPRRRRRLRPAGRSGIYSREGEGRRGRGQRRGERGDRHPDLFHQWPPLRRAMGRKRACRCDAGHARSSGALGGARFRQLGTIGGRPPPARDDRRRRLDQQPPGAGVRRVLGPTIRPHVRRSRLFAVA